ncbi:MAG: universal stress protein [Armatimonadota bacterium]
MKIVLGVDSEGAYESALHWLIRLRFQEPEVLLTAVLEPLRPPLVGLLAPLPEEVMLHSLQAQEQAAEQALQRARTMLETAGIPTTSLIRRGHASTELLRTAEENGASLLALGSTGKRGWRAWLLGSVGRAAVDHATQSLLIARQPPSTDKPLHAVIATDHSDYNRRCLQRLLQFAPQGIQKLLLTTAFELDSEMLELLGRTTPALKESGSQWIIEQLHERNRELCEQLRPLGAGCESLVVEGATIPALRAVLDETGAELLILGAKGHSLLERLTLGSVSHHFATAESYNLLILRV